MMRLKAVYVAKSEYKGKTLFPFWNNIKVGHYISFSVEIKPIGEYKPIIRVKNIATGEVFNDSMTRIHNYLLKIELEELEELD
jgi:hypothetical protein